MGGFWVAAMQFNPLPSATTVSMMAMNNVAIGGVRFLAAGLAAQVLGIGVGLVVFAPAFIPPTSPLQLYACLPLLMLYPLALGWICFRQAYTLGLHKRELLALSRTDSLTGLLNHGAWKDQLEVEFQRCRRQQQGAAIALISCYQGFHCQAGAEGVGRAATAAFVYSFIVILVLDLFLGIGLDQIYFMIWPESSRLL